MYKLISSMARVRTTGALQSFIRWHVFVPQQTRNYVNIMRRHQPLHTMYCVRVEQSRFCDISQTFCKSRVFSTTHCPSAGKSQWDKSQSTRQRMRPSNEEAEERSEEMYQEFMKELRGWKKDLSTIPNLLSACRMASGFVMIPLILQEAYVPAFVVFTLAALTDLADGYIARRWPGQASVSGTVLDPVADKVLMFSTTLCLMAVNLMPAALVITIVTRDMLLVSGGLLLRYASLPKPVTSRAFWRLNVKVKPNIFSKVTTTFQMASVIAALGAPIFGYMDHAVLNYLYLWTAGVTFASGISYTLRPGVFQFVAGKDSDKL